MKIVTAHNTAHVYTGRTTASGTPDCVTVVFAPDGSVASVRSNGRPMNPAAPKARKAIEAIRAQPFAPGSYEAQRYGVRTPKP